MHTPHPGPRKCFTVAATLAFTVSIVQAQMPAAQNTAFEVASIRMVQPYTEDEILRGLGNSPLSRFPSNRFTARHVNLAFMLAVAYGADQRRIENEPAWMDDQTYDFEAKVEGDQELTYEQMKPLIQDLLEHRFHLVVHWVTKPSSGYALVEAKNGPKLVRSKGPTNSAGYLMPDGMNFRDISMSSFAAMLSHPIGGAIEDRTGISGNYDIKIKFAPAGDANSSLPDIFTAVQEQLGLKLEPTKVPVTFLVIDHVDRIPTEN